MTIETTYTVLYHNNLELALQQRQSKLAPFAMQVRGEGELTEIKNLLDSALPERITTRFQEITLDTGDFQRRWAPVTEPYIFVRGVDSWDRVKSAIDVEGGYVQAGAATIARGRDMAFLEGFFGTNYTGKTGQTTVEFDPTNIVAVNEGAAVPTGLNIDKLAAAQETLRANHVDLEMEEACMALTARQIRNLQGEVEMISQDFNPGDAPVLRNGVLTKLLGFNFVPMEFGDASSVGAEVAALTLDPSGYRKVPFWVKSGMAMVTWEDLFARVSERPELNYAKQVYARTILTGSRTDEAKCGIILCDE